MFLSVLKTWTCGLSVWDRWFKSVSSQGAHWFESPVWHTIVYVIGMTVASSFSFQEGISYWNTDKLKMKSLHWRWDWGSLCLLLAILDKTDHQNPWESTTEHEIWICTLIYCSFVGRNTVIGACDWHSVMMMERNKWPESVYLSSISYSQPPPHYCGVETSTQTKYTHFSFIHPD